MLYHFINFSDSLYSINAVIDNNAKNNQENLTSWTYSKNVKN